MKKLFLLLLSGLCLQAHAQVITTIAGGGTAINDDSLATHAGLSGPIGVALDKAGNIYIGDRDHDRVRKINPNGIITTIAGTGSGSYSGDGGPATAAKINSPYGVAVDASGNIYIADGYNFRIRKVDNAGVITTLAGTGTPGYNGDNIAATAAQIGASGIAVDAVGNVYIADNDNNRVRKINTSGIITTIAGTGSSGNSGDGMPATAAELNDPYGIAVDGNGNIYIAEDHGNMVRKVNKQGIISTIAGTGIAGYSGDGDAATAAQLDRSCGVSVDGYGNVYIADAHNNRIRKVNTAGIISTIAGNGKTGYAGDNGAAVYAELNDPTGVAIDGNGGIYIADFGNSRIRYIRNTVGVAKVSSIESELTLYPNPSNGTFTLQVASGVNEPMQIRIMNELGATIKEINAYTNQSIRLTIDVPAGIYMLTAATNEGRWNKTMIINPRF